MIGKYSWEYFISGIPKFIVEIKSVRGVSATRLRRKKNHNQHDSLQQNDQ
jgi:hypothetical protein